MWGERPPFFLFAHEHIALHEPAYMCVSTLKRAGERERTQAGHKCVCEVNKKTRSCWQGSLLDRCSRWTDSSNATGNVRKETEENERGRMGEGDGRRTGWRGWGIGFPLTVCLGSSTCSSLRSSHCGTSSTLGCLFLLLGPMCCGLVEAPKTGPGQDRLRRSLLCQWNTRIIVWSTSEYGFHSNTNYTTLTHLFSVAIYSSTVNLQQILFFRKWSVYKVIKGAESRQLQEIVDFSRFWSLCNFMPI